MQTAVAPSASALEDISAVAEAAVDEHRHRAGRSSSRFTDALNRAASAVLGAASVIRDDDGVYLVLAGGFASSRATMPLRTIFSSA